MNTKNYMTVLWKPVTYCHYSTDPSGGKTEGKSDANNVFGVEVSTQQHPHPQRLYWPAVARAGSLRPSPQSLPHLRPPEGFPQVCPAFSPA